MSFIRKVKGHTTIILRNVKTGKVEVYEDDNMQTNAMLQYFANCGFLNYPNLNQNQLVDNLLSGIMAFDGTITESADNTKVPAGLTMIANGAVGVQNADEVVDELGSCSNRPEETGWQDEETYLMTFDFTTAQGNGLISCICITGGNYALAGEGNAHSKGRYAASHPSLTNLAGDVVSYDVVGHVFNIDFVASTIDALDLTDAGTTGKGVLRKYSVPISKINLRGTQSNPVILSETEITLPTEMTNAATLKFQAHNGNLLIWNFDTESDHVWGSNFTQYLWTLAPSGTITSETLVNTSGDELHGIQNAIFDGDYIFFCPTYYQFIWDSQWRYHNNTQTIYIMNRTSGVISKISNPYGDDVSGKITDLGAGSSGWIPYHTSGDGRIYLGGYSCSYVVDAVLNKVYPTNSATRYGYDVNGLLPVTGLIKHSGADLYRDQMYIATINNLETPINKTVEKTMKIVYRLTFPKQ